MNIVYALVPLVALAIAIPIARWWDAKEALKWRVRKVVPLDPSMRELEAMLRISYDRAVEAMLRDITPAFQKMTKAANTSAEALYHFRKTFGGEP